MVSDFKGGEVESPYVLVVFSSLTGSAKNLAHSVARGVNMCEGIEAKIRTVPSVEEIVSHGGKEVHESQGVAYVTQEELEGCHGLAIGSPTHFGNMASGLQYWMEQTTSLWFSGGLVNKPVSVFCASASLHGGQETTLMNIITPLLHHGMIVVGVPYTVEELTKTQGGGTPYGATHVSGESSKSAELTDDEHAICIAQGRRLAEVSLRLGEMGSRN